MCLCQHTTNLALKKIGTITTTIGSLKLLKKTLAIERTHYSVDNAKKHAHSCNTQTTPPIVIAPPVDFFLSCLLFGGTTNIPFHLQNHI